MQLELPQKYEVILRSADLNNTSQLPQIIEAANALHTAINAPIPTHLLQLQVSFIYMRNLN